MSSTPKASTKASLVSPAVKARNKNQPMEYRLQKVDAAIKKKTITPEEIFQLIWKYDLFAKYQVNGYSREELVDVAPVQLAYVMPVDYMGKYDSQTLHEVLSKGVV
jgi:hypothetical protein